MTRFYFALALALLLTPIGLSQDRLNLITHAAEGPARATHVTASGLSVYQDGYYIVIGTVLRDADGTRFAETSRLLLPGRAEEIVSTATHLYAATTTGTAAIDITNPRDPELSAFEDGTVGWSIDVGDGHVYVARRTGQVDVFDITSGLTRVATASAQGGRPYVRYHEGALYVSNGYHSGVPLFVYDVTDPASPSLVRGHNGLGNATLYDAIVHDDVLYIATASGARAFDVSAPLAITTLDIAQTDDVLVSLAVGTDGVHATADSWTDGPSAAYTLGMENGELIARRTGDLPVHAASAAWDPATGLFLLAADHTGVWFADLADEPAIVGSFRTGGYGERVAFDGSMLYTVSSAGTLRVIDLARTGPNSQRGRLEISGGIYAMEASEGLIYIIQERFQVLRIIDARNPDAPVMMSTLPLETRSARSMLVDGSTVYVPGGSDGLVVVDASDPASPFEAARYAVSPDHFKDISLVALDEESRTLYVAETRGNRLFALDAADPTQMTVLSEVALDSRPNLLAVEGPSLALTIRHPQTLFSYDVSNPAEPALKWEEPLDLYGQTDIDVTGGSVYLLNSIDGVTRHDADGVLTHVFDTPDDPRDMDIHGDKITVAAGGAGVYVLGAPPAAVGTGASPEAAGLRLLLAPNPVQNRLTISAEGVDAPSYRVAVLDLLGREVLGRSGALAGGSVDEEIDTSRLAAGVYVVRLHAGDEVATARLTVVR